MIKMRRYKRAGDKKKFLSLFEDYFPTGRDNLIQVSIKICFLFCIIGIIVGGIYFGNHYYTSYADQKQIQVDQELFENGDLSILKKQNSDYKAWLRIKGTKLSNPVFKTDNNSFYLTHGSSKEKNNYGSLFLDYRCDFSDKNAVVYGNNAENGLMFATLNRLRELDFYKSNYIITLNEGKTESRYLIYAVFVLNSSKEQDGGKIYSIYQKEFSNEATFKAWVNEAKTRSLVNSEIDVDYEDSILTLVTDCDDFEGARLVVMARKTRDKEYIFTDNKKAELNPNPKYPKKWYVDRNIKYPF
ncbi:MAG: class B sortase [Clostridia bacterium]|nr:class B sortase [Clostridia bacterium]